MWAGYGCLKLVHRDALALNYKLFKGDLSKLFVEFVVMYPGWCFPYFQSFALFSDDCSRISQSKIKGAGVVKWIELVSFYN